MAVYLDNNATTAIAPVVLRKLCKSLYDTYGNPSDLYNIGVVAKREIDEARKSVASLIGAELSTVLSAGADLSEDRIIFTGCATEANNAVFRSAVKTYPKKNHIIISSVEHLSVLEIARDLEQEGYKLTLVPVDANGNLNLEFLQKSIKKDTLLVSIMMANNETGVIFPIDEIVRIVREHSSETLIHTDAVQATGKIPINTKSLGIDFLSISGHKFHAPKGVGALYIKKGIPFYPFLLGGHQEKRMRAGTENTASIIAMGEAARLALENAKKQNEVKRLRDYLETALLDIPIPSYILGKEAPRLPNTTNIAFANIDGVNLMLNLSQQSIYISTGSACNSTIADPSHVVMAMGTQPEYQKSVRVSLSNDTTQQEIDQFIQAIQKLLNKKGK